jgi:outer membrane receptor protein involved in Fe transport
LGSSLQPLTINTTVTDFLPSVNAVYALTKKMNVRLSYAQTVNRPEYRELAEVVFYDYLQQYSLNGSSELQRAKVKNYDFRYEFFPGKAQLFSASVFYKEFKNPIEFLFIPALQGNQGFYANTTSATLKGVEFEFRSLVSTLFGVTREKSILNKFTLSANASFTESIVQILDTISLIPPSEFRNNDPLQGQSPFVVNGSINFTDNKLGISTTLSANKFGDRILVKGVSFPQALPNLLEKGRTVIDFQFAKLFLKNQLEVKLNIRDLLAQDILLYRDLNEESSTFTNKDQKFSVYKAPTTVTIGVSYKF